MKGSIDMTFNSYKVRIHLTEEWVEQNEWYDEVDTWYSDNIDGTWKDFIWSGLAALGYLIDTEAWDYAEAVSPDGKVLYYVENGDEY